MIGRIGRAVLLGGLLLGGCTNQPVDTSINPILSEAWDTIGASVRPKPAPSGPLITREKLATISAPVLLITVEQSGEQGTAIPLGVNGDAVTWITANGASLTFKGQALFSTRGLGADLLTAEMGGLPAAIASRSPARYGRAMRFINGDESIRKERYFCELTRDGSETRVVLGRSHATTRLRESCYELNGSYEFQNLFWVGGDGTVWDSRQWVSATVGHLVVQRLQ
mgnify:CR=1 FL=1